MYTVYPIISYGILLQIRIAFLNSKSYSLFMRSIFKNMRNRIQDTGEGKLCNCHRPHLLTFPDIEDNYEIFTTEMIEKAGSTVQFVKTKVTAQCKVCGIVWIIEVTSGPDRRTRVWKKKVNPLS